MHRTRRTLMIGIIALLSLACAGGGLTREERALKTVSDAGYLDPKVVDSSRIGLKVKGCRRDSDKAFYKIEATDAQERPVSLKVCCGRRCRIH